MKHFSFILILSILCTGFVYSGSKGSHVYPEDLAVDNSSTTVGDYYDAENVTIKWNNRMYPTPFYHDQYTQVLATYQLYKLTFSGKRKTRVNSTYTTITNNYSKTIEISRVSGVSTMVYKIDPSLFPVYANNSCTVYIEGTVTIAVYQYQRISVNGIITYTDQKQCGTAATDSPYEVFNETPAQPKSFDINANNEDSPENEWSGPETAEIILSWDSDFRFRNQSYEILKNDVSLITAKYYDNGIREINLEENDEYFDHGFNTLIMYAIDEYNNHSTGYIQSNNFTLKYDKNPPLEPDSPPSPLNTYIVSDFTYDYNWYPAVDDNSAIEENSGVYKYNWQIRDDYGLFDSGSIMHIDTAVEYMVTKGIKPYDSSGLDRNTTYNIFINVDDRVINTGSYTPVEFKTPPNKLELNLVTPDESVVKNAQNSPVYDVYLEMGIGEAIDWNDYFCLDTTSNYTHRVENITILRYIDEDLNGVKDSNTPEAEFSFIYSDIFDAGGGTQTNWSLDDENDLIFKDISTGSNYAHNKMVYQVITNFGQATDGNDLIESTDEIPSPRMYNYFPVCAVNVKSDDVTLWTFESDNPENEPLISPIWLGKESVFEFTASLDELDADAKDIEGDTAYANLYKMTSDNNPENIKQLDFRNGETIDAINSASGDKILNGSNSLYILFKDDYKDSDDSEYVPTNTVNFIYDGGEPVINSWKVFNIDKNPHVQLIPGKAIKNDWILIKDINAQDAQMPGAISGIEKLLLWNGEVSLSNDLSDFLNVVPVFNSITQRAELDLNTFTIEDQESIINGQKGILLDINALASDPDPVILFGDDNEYLLDIIWPYKPETTTPEEAAYDVNMQVIDGVNNKSLVDSKTINFDTIPPDPPAGLEISYVYNENTQNMEITFTTNLVDENDEPLSLNDVNGDTIKYLYKYEFVDTPLDPPITNLTDLDEDVVSEELLTGDLVITINVPQVPQVLQEDAEWDKCIKMSLWAEDWAENVSGFALYGDNVFSPAFPSTDLVQLNALNDLDAQNHIYFQLEPADDAVAASQKLIVLENGISTDIELELNTDGHFIFDNNGTGCSGHTEYAFQIVAFNQNGDSRTGDTFYFTPDNHDVIASSVNEMDPATGSHYNSNNLVFSWDSFTDVDADTIKYRIFCKKVIDAEYKLLTGSDGIIGLQLLNNDFASILFTSPEADEGEYEWYLEAYDTYYDGTNPVTGNTVRLPDTTSIVFTIDNTEPVVNIQIDPLKEYYNSNTIDVYIIEENGSLILSYTDGSYSYSDITVTEYDGAAGHYIYSLQLTGDGEREVNVDVTDSAENTGSDSANLKVDTELPDTSAILIDLPVENNQYLSTTGLININGMVDTYSGVKNVYYSFENEAGDIVLAEDTQQITYYSGDTSSKDLALNLYSNINIANGNYLVLRVEDWAENIAEWTSPYPVSFALTLPKITKFIINDLNDFMSTLVPVSIEVEAENPESTIDTIEYCIILDDNEEETGWFDSWDDLVNAYTIADTGITTLLNNIYRIKIKATSENGLSSTMISEDSFTIDTTEPTFDFTIQPNTSLTQSELVSIDIDGEDPDSGIKSYSIAIGSLPDTTDFTDKITGQVNGWLTSYGIAGEFLLSVPEDIADGTYYMQLKVENNAGVVSTNAGLEHPIVISEREAILVKNNGQYTSSNTSLKASWEYNGLRELSYYMYEIIDENNMSIWQDTVGQETSVTVNDLNLTEGSIYRFVITGYFTDSTIISGESLGIKVDTTPPEFYITQDEPEYSYPLASRSDNIKVSWNGKDDESYIIKREILVEKYNEANEKEVISGGWITVLGDSSYVTKDTEGNSLDIITGDQIYITVRLTNGSGLSSDRTSSLILIDNTPPDTPFIIDAGEIVHTGSASVVWANWKWSKGDNESGVIKYLWTLSQFQTEVGLAEWIEETDRKTVYFNEHPVFAGLTEQDLHTKEWFIAVKAVNGAGSESGIGWSDGIIFDNTAPTIAEVKLLNSNFVDDNDIEYINTMNINDELVLSISADEDILDNIASYEGSYNIWNEVDNNWVDASYNVVKQVTPEDTSGIIPLTGLTVTPSELLRFRGSAINMADLESGYGYSGGVMYDNTIPQITNIHVFAMKDSFHFDWIIEETQTITAIKECKIAFIGAADTASEQDFVENTYGLYSYIHPTASLAHGEYKLAIKVTDEAGNYQIQYSGIVSYDETPPEVNFFMTGGYDEYISKSLDFKVKTYEDLSIITEYQYKLGSFEDPGALTDGWIGEIMGLGSGENNIERTFCFEGYDGVIDNTKIEIYKTLIDKNELYLAIRVKNSQGKWSVELVSGKIIVDKTIPSTPVVVVPDYTASATSVTFNKQEFNSVDNESGITHFRLAVIEDNTDINTANIALESSSVKLISELPDTVLFDELFHEDARYIAVQTLNGAKDWSQTGFSNLFTIDLMAPELLLLNSQEEIVVNDVPHEVLFTVDEYSEITFGLYNSSNELVYNTSLTCNEPGEYSYIFQVQEDDYDTYTLLIEEIKDIVLNQKQNESLVDIRLNAPPVIIISDMQTFPGKVLTLDAAVYDGDIDGIATYSWLINDGTDFIPLLPETDYIDGVSFDSVFEHHSITDQVTDYEVKLLVVDNAEKENSKIVNVTVINTQYGTLYRDEVWTGDHYITGDIIVPGDRTLIIDNANVMVKNTFGFGEINMDMRGMIIIKNNTIFSLSDEAHYDFWTGIYITGIGDVTNTTIMDARFGITTLPGSDVIITQSSKFENNEIGIRVHGTSPEISSCLIFYNSIYGIKEDSGGNPIVKDTAFSGNLYDYYDEEHVVLKADEVNNIRLENQGNYTVGGGE